MNREEAKQLKERVAAKLQEIDVDGQFIVKRATYSNNSMSITIDFLEGDESKNKTGEQVAFEKDCQTYGLRNEDYLAEIPMEGTQMKLYGFNPRARKYPCLLRAPDGKEYKCSLDYVVWNLRK